MTTRNPLILIIDDEPEICRNCVKILSKMDYDVRYALNGYDALKMVDDTVFDVVVTDLKMSNVGGMEVLRRLKFTHPEIRVIVLTGHGSEKDKEEAFRLGAFEYLQKPVDIENITKHIQCAYENKINKQRSMTYENPSSFS